MRKLSRYCLAEASKLMCFYGSIYLALFATAFAGRFLRDGAPFVDVVLALPAQMALPLTLALPLAMITAMIGTIGRMREDGEIIALQAAGLSPISVVWRLWPLTILVAAMVGYLAHSHMPRASQNWREGLTNLARAGIATKVSRQEPIYQNQSQGMVVTAQSTTGDMLQEVFIWQKDEDDNQLVAYAPQALWINNTLADENGNRLRLAFSDARMWRLSPEADGNALTYGLFSRFINDRLQEAPDRSYKPDALSTPALDQGISHFGYLLASAEDENTSIHTVIKKGLQQLPVPPSNIRSWRNLRRLLSASSEHPARALLSQASRDAIDSGNDLSDTELTQLQMDLDGPINEQILTLPIPEPLSAGHHLNTVLRDYHRGTWSADEQQIAMLRRLFLHYHFPGVFASGLSIHALTEAGKREGDRLHKSLRKELRGMQIQWHLRWVLCASVFGYWLFGCATALSISSRNRLLSMSIGMGIVLLTILPAFAIAKGLRSNLTISPAYILWPPCMILSVLGVMQCWRKR